MRAVNRIIATIDILLFTSATAIDDPCVDDCCHALAWEYHVVVIPIDVGYLSLRRPYRHQNHASDRIAYMNSCLHSENSGLTEACFWYPYVCEDDDYITRHCTWHRVIGTNGC